MSLKYSAYILTCCSALLVSCGNDDNSTEKTAVTDTATQNVQCYKEQVGGDITVVELHQEHDKVTGYYAWIPKEKDSGRGSFVGTIKANYISAQYTYLIEGATQTEEVAFKLDGDTLLQGQGELVDKADGSLALKDPTKLTWSTTLKKVDCKTIKNSLDDTKRTAEEIKKAK